MSDNRAETTFHDQRLRAVIVTKIAKTLNGILADVTDVNTVAQEMENSVFRKYQSNISGKENMDAYTNDIAFIICELQKIKSNYSICSGSSAERLQLLLKSIQDTNNNGIQRDSSTTRSQTAAPTTKSNKNWFNNIVTVVKFKQQHKVSLKQAKELISLRSENEENIDIAEIDDFGYVIYGQSDPNEIERNRSSSFSNYNLVRAKIEGSDRVDNTKLLHKYLWELSLKLRQLKDPTRLASVTEKIDQFVDFILAEEEKY